MLLVAGSERIRQKKIDGQIYPLQKKTYIMKGGPYMVYGTKVVKNPTQLREDFYFKKIMEGLNQATHFT
jgi:hypothetical protein